MNLGIDRRLVVTHVLTGEEVVPKGEEGVPKGKEGVPKGKEHSSDEDSSSFQLGSSDSSRPLAETMCADNTAKVQFKGVQSSDPERSDEGDSLVIIRNDDDQEPEFVCEESDESGSINQVQEKYNPGSNYIPRELSLKDAGGRLKPVSFREILNFFKLPSNRETSFGGDSENLANLATAKTKFEEFYPAAGIVGRFGQTGSGKISGDIKFLKNLKKPDMRDEYVWLNLRKFIQQIFGDSVNTGWGSSFQELDDLLPENTPKDPDAKFVSIPSNSLEFLDTTIDFLIDLLKDRQASLKKSERSTQVKAAKVTVITLLASFLAGIFSGVVADKQPNQVQVAETPSEHGPARAKLVSLSRSENVNLKNKITNQDPMTVLGSIVNFDDLYKLLDYEFAYKDLVNVDTAEFFKKSGMRLWQKEGDYIDRVSGFKTLKPRDMQDLTLLVPALVYSWLNCPDSANQMAGPGYKDTISGLTPVVFKDDRDVTDIPKNPVYLTYGLRGPQINVNLPSLQVHLQDSQKLGAIRAPRPVGQDNSRKIQLSF